MWGASNRKTESVEWCGRKRGGQSKRSEIKSAKHKNLLHMKRIETHNRVHILGRIVE